MYSDPPPPMVRVLCLDHKSKCYLGTYNVYAYQDEQKMFMNWAVCIDSMYIETRSIKNWPVHQATLRIVSSRGPRANLAMTVQA